MPAPHLPPVFLARHGQTAWNLSGLHTGLTDLPLTAAGEDQARQLGGRLKGLAFDRVLCSPLQRASRTCQLAGFGSVAEPDVRLVESDCGDDEGRTGAQIHLAQPGWRMFRDGCPGGESPAQVATRADSVIATLQASDAPTTLLFSSGHFLRMPAARCLGLASLAGANFMLDTASLSVLGCEHTLAEAVVRPWNETRHAEP